MRAAAKTIHLMMILRVRFCHIAWSHISRKRGQMITCIGNSGHHFSAAGRACRVPILETFLLIALLPTRRKPATTRSGIGVLSDPEPHEKPSLR
jgi:hypothetical protein